MTTRKQISKAIFKATGDNVGVFGSAKDGCYHFYSDDVETSNKLTSLYSVTVYVNSLSQMTVTQWLDEYKVLTKDVINVR